MKPSHIFYVDLIIKLPYNDIGKVYKKIFKRSKWEKVIFVVKL